MLKSGRVRPSKSSSILGMIVGIIFVLIGVTTGYNYGWAYLDYFGQWELL